MGEIMAAMTFEEEEDFLLVYCVSRGAIDILRKIKDTDTTFWKFFRVSTDIFQFLVI
jgi:hypothetical protein